MMEYQHWLLGWGSVWAGLILFSPEGPKAISTAYRLNFWHGVMSSITAILCVAGLIPDSLAVPCSLAYFGVDVLNMLMNDFYFKVESYHKPFDRKAEYFHHLLCIVVCVTSRLYSQTYCHGISEDPVVRIMLAEISTPFLIMFRRTKSKVAGGLFVLSFILTRTVYQCLFLMPGLFVACKPVGIRYGMVVPYILLQLYFTFRVIVTASRGDKGSKTKNQQSKLREE